VTGAGKGAARRKHRSAEGDDTTLHLRLTPEDQRHIKAVLGFMLNDPAADVRVSYAGAIRYALDHCVRQPPAHVKGRHS